GYLTGRLLAVPRSSWRRCVADQSSDHGGRQWFGGVARQRRVTGHAACGPACRPSGRRPSWTCGWMAELPWPWLGDDEHEQGPGERGPPPVVAAEQLLGRVRFAEAGDRESGLVQGVGVELQRAKPCGDRSG